MHLFRHDSGALESDGSAFVFRFPMWGSSGKCAKTLYFTIVNASAGTGNITMYGAESGTTGDTGSRWAVNFTRGGESPVAGAPSYNSFESMVNDGTSTPKVYLPNIGSNSSSGSKVDQLEVPYFEVSCAGTTGTVTITVDGYGE